MFWFIHFIDYSWFPFPCRPAGAWVVDIRVAIRGDLEAGTKGVRFPTDWLQVPQSQGGQMRLWAPGRPCNRCPPGWASLGAGPWMPLVAAWVGIGSLLSVQLLHLFTPEHPAPSDAGVSRPFGRAISLHWEGLHLWVECGNLVMSPGRVGFEHWCLWPVSRRRWDLWKAWGFWIWFIGWKCTVGLNCWFSKHPTAISKLVLIALSEISGGISVRCRRRLQAKQSLFWEGIQEYRNCLSWSSPFFLQDQPLYPNCKP